MQFLKKIFNTNKKSNLEKHILFSDLYRKNNSLFFSHLPVFFFYTLLISPIWGSLFIMTEHIFPLFYEKYLNIGIILFIVYFIMFICLLIDWIFYDGKNSDFFNQIRYGRNKKYNYKKFLKEKNKALKLLFSMNISKEKIESFILELERENLFNNDTLKNLHLYLKEIYSYQNTDISEEHKSKNVINNFLKENPSFRQHNDNDIEENQELVFFKQNKQKSQ